jgi:Glycosyl transferases group 1
VKEPGLAGRRVVFVLEWPAFGGSERQALLLAEHLKHEGVEVEVFALREEDGRGAELFRAAGIPWRGRRATWNGTVRSGATLARLAAELRRTRPDVLLPFCELPNTVCGLTWRYAGATTCVWSQRVLAGRSYGRKEGLEALAHELGVAETVRFPGEVDDVAGLLGAADAGVLASTPAEGCPNAVLECMAAGLAVAATDVPGVREALGEEGTRFLAPRGDAAALGAILGRLAQDRQLRIERGERNRRRILEHFGVERSLDQYVGVIRTGLGWSPPYTEAPR